MSDLAAAVREGRGSVSLDGSVVTVMADSFSRSIDLKRVFPGAYPAWDHNPPIVDLDEEHGLLRVGTERDPDYREHIDFEDPLFVDSSGNQN